MHRLLLERLTDELIANAARAAAPMPPADSLDLDTRYNVTYRNPLIASLMARRPLQRPGDMTHELFKSVLGVDLADPYLGLAPYVLGGELGRHEPEPEPEPEH